MQVGTVNMAHGLIPPTEIWVKLDDKGGTSFKASLQIVNTYKPKSVKNSCVFAVFEAPDTSTNLHIALNRFQDQVSDIQSSNWK